MSSDARDRWLAQIRANIAAHGHHPSARPLLDLPVGKALARTWPGEWEAWGT